MRRLNLFPLLAAALLAAPSCGEPPEFLIEVPVIHGPLSVSWGLIYVEETRGVAVEVAPGDAATSEEVTVRTLDVGIGASVLVALPDAEGAPAGYAVLNGATQRLILVDAAGAEPREVELGDSYSSVVISPNGRYAVAWFGADSADTLFSVPNKLAVVTLATGVVQETVLRSFGSFPQSFAFSEQFVLRDAAGPTSLELMVVVAESYVSIIDLAHPERGDIHVPLTAGGGGGFVAQQVLFTNNLGEADGGEDGEEWLFLRVSDSRDLYAVRVALAESGEHDVALSVNLLSPTSSGGFRNTPRDIEAVVANGALYVVGVDGTSTIAVLSVKDSADIVVPADISVDRVERFVEEGTGESHLLLVDSTGSNRSVLFLRMEDIERKRGKNLDSLRLSERVSAVEMGRGATLGSAVVHHTSGQRLSFLDLSSREVFELQAQETMVDRELSADWSQLYVAAQQNDVPVVARIDLATGAYGKEVAKLDTWISSLRAVDGWVAALHVGTEGHVTFVPEGRFTHDNALVARGFLLDAMASYTGTRKAEEEAK